MTPSEKIARWIDLLSALLSSRRPLTFKELAQRVPAYLADGSLERGEPSNTLKRMFERDKDELRGEGVPIESPSAIGEEESVYTVRNANFYLPYLALVSERGIEMPAKVTKFGYGGLTSVTFEPDELQIIGDSAKRVLQLGDDELADEALNAMRKLAFDLPVGATDGDASSSDAVLPATSVADARVLALLGDALYARKRVRFVYHTIGSDTTATRTVEPYGLFYVSGHWYLAARDVDKDAVRNFRVSRTQKAVMLDKKIATPDFVIPPTFKLREHTKSKLAWELGEADSMMAVVDFCGESGACVAARKLGAQYEQSETKRTFNVRRGDSFARWVLSFAGDSVPVEPASLVAQYRDMVRETQLLYASGSSSGHGAQHG